MAIVKALLAASDYLLRYSFDYDGINAPESITVTNAELLADLGAHLGSPLRDFRLDVSGLTQLECHARFNSSSFAIYSRVENLVGGSSFPGYGQDMDADADGRPQLVVDFPIKDTRIVAIIDLEFRHSYSR